MWTTAVWLTLIQADHGHCSLLHKGHLCQSPASHVHNQQTQRLLEFRLNVGPILGPVVELVCIPYGSCRGTLCLVLACALPLPPRRNPWTVIHRNTRVRHHQLEASTALYYHGRFHAIDVRDLLVGSRG